MAHRDEILTRMENEANIPSFPSIVAKLTQLLKDEETSTDDIVDTIRIDPVVASSILRLANTMAFNISGGKISSIQEAVVRLGFRNISDLVISLVVIRSFGTNGMINYTEFWSHSLSVAFASQIISDNAALVFRRPDDIYVSGLLHEIGLLILDQFFPEYYENVLNEVRNSEEELFEIERELLGIDHAEVGAFLLERWQLPQAVCDAVRFQHKPHISTHFSDQATKIIHLANFACENQGISNGLDKFPSEFSKVAWDDLGLSVDNIPLIIDTVKKQTEKAKEIFAAALSSGETDKELAEA